MSRAMTASPKPSFRASWRVGDAVVGIGNAGWTTSKNEHPCPCRNCSQGLPAEKTGRESSCGMPHKQLSQQFNLDRTSDTAFAVAISSTVLRPGLKPACSSVGSSFALVLSHLRITRSMIALGWLIRLMVR